jgi:Ni/Fe-hydrogenase subunit HybB-like protein
VGRPWRLPYPFFVQSGPTSVLFEVGLCVMLYLTTLFIEWLPACLEWLGIRKPRDVIVRTTLALTIFGVVLSTMHQSSFGGLYLISPAKIYPLWYSSFLPVYFFISSIAAGFSMVILLDTLSIWTLRNKMDNVYMEERQQVSLGFAKAAACVLASYFAIKLVGITLANDWHYLWTGWGMWFLFELLGFAVLPALLFAIGVREKNLKVIRWAALLCVLGIILNRFNVTLVAYNWLLPAAERYFPSWMEIVISIYQITLAFVAFRFVISRMPIYYEHPNFRKHVPLEYEEEEPRKFEEHPLKPHPQTFGH